MKNKRKEDRRGRSQHSLLPLCSSRSLCLVCIATNPYPTQTGARHTAERLRAGPWLPTITNVLASASTVQLEDKAPVFEDECVTWPRCLVETLCEVVLHWYCWRYLTCSFLERWIAEVRAKRRRVPGSRTRIYRCFLEATRVSWGESRLQSHT